MFMQVFERDNLLAEVEFDPVTEKVFSYKAYSNNIVKLPFGACMDPDYSWVISFLESRSPDKDNYAIKELLHNWGLAIYDPLAIVRKTHGLMMNDYFWVRFDNEDITYDNIKVRVD